jgi:hypothetical protein
MTHSITELTLDKIRQTTLAILEVDPIPSLDWKGNDCTLNYTVY